MAAQARGERGSKASQAVLVLAAAGAILGASLMINHQHSMRHAIHVRELQESLAQQLEFARPSVLALQQLEAVGVNPMDKDSDQATILVSVVAFRDPECHRTVKDLFRRAKNPRRVFVALVDQLDPNFPHEECSVQKHWPWSSHVRAMRFSSDLSRGSVVSRYFSSMLYRNEDFWFQIDAHCLFEPHWDAKLVDMWKERVTLLADAGMGDRVILSHYPLAYNSSSLQVSEMAALHTTAQCSGVFSEDGIFTPRAWAIKKEKAQQLRLQPVPAIAGGMVFGVGRLVLDVPFDPWLLHIFSGDELDYSLRAYSKGYRVFNPTDNIVYHHYGRPDRPRTWATHADQGYAVMSQTSEDRVKAALRVEPITADTEAVVKMQLDVYGISVESRQEWEREFGINLTARTIAHDWC